MADPQEAALLLQLLQWGTALGFDDAKAVLAAEDFDPEQASFEDAPIRAVLTFGEALGALAKHGLIGRELIDDFVSVGLLWELVGPAGIRLRERLGDDALFENFEALATSQRSGD